MEYEELRKLAGLEAQPDDKNDEGDESPLTNTPPLAVEGVEADEEVVDEELEVDVEEEVEEAVEIDVDDEVVDEELDVDKEPEEELDEEKDSDWTPPWEDDDKEEEVEEAIGDMSLMNTDDPTEPGVDAHDDWDQLFTNDDEAAADEWASSPEADPFNDKLDAGPFENPDEADPWEAIWAQHNGNDQPDLQMGEDVSFENGYEDVQDHEELADYGADFFPDAQTSTAVNRVGPSAAKHGNNPQKAKQFTEGADKIHENLVYRYRAFKKQS